MNLEYYCRICLEKDDMGNMVFPCRCSGTSKWVHKECLNQWRTLSDNSEAFYKCFECNYRYKIVNNNYIKTNFDKCIEYFSKYLIAFLFFNMAVIFFLFNFIVYLDKDHTMIKIIFHHYNQKHLTDYYLVTSSILYLSIFFVIVLIKFSLSRNKMLYFKYYFRNWSFFFILLFIGLSLFVCSMIYLNSIYILSMMTICVQLFFKHYLNIQEIIKKENQLEIQNYSEENDILYGSNTESTYLLS